VSETRSSLLRRIKDLGDGPSWEEFDHLYRPLLIRYAAARGVDANEAGDIAQECMAAIAAGMQDFKRRVSFRAWLRGMIDHKVADHFRKRGREVHAKTREFEATESPDDSPALSWEKEWNRTHLLYWLSQIRQEVTPLTYHAFELYVLDERPVMEIARLLGMSANQVYVAKHRAEPRRTGYGPVPGEPGPVQGLRVVRRLLPQACPGNVGGPKRRRVSPGPFGPSGALQRLRTLRGDVS
jgi:RNA polymerase sigma-70 factor (ECF subfamily)